MNCVDVRHLIHLDVGGDLGAAEEHEVASHIERCGECRGYHSGMLKAMSALQTLRAFDPPSGGSFRNSSGIWSAVAARLPARNWRPAVQKQFNTRVAALCVCSLALAVVTIVQNLPVANMSGTTSSFPALRFASGQFGTNAATGSAASFSGGDSFAPRNHTPMTTDIADDSDSLPQSF